MMALRCAREFQQLGQDAPRAQRLLLQLRQTNGRGVVLRGAGLQGQRGLGVRSSCATSEANSRSRWARVCNVSTNALMAATVLAC